MRSDRLSLALDSGVLTLPPAGVVGVFGPCVGEDLSALPKDRLLVVTGQFPDHAHFTRAGYSCAIRCDRDLAAALVCLPRSREAGRGLVAEAVAAVAPGGLVAVDGQKTDGIEPLLRELRALLPPGALGETVTKAHGRLAVFAAGAGDLSGWLARDRKVGDGFLTRPGVFSADGPDRGSELLAAALPAKLPGRVVDLGAGWGYLGRAILARDGVERLDLVEADAVALDCARANLTDPRAAFHWADATQWKPDRPADAVVCNPPFHAGRETDPGLGVAFLRAAARMLAPQGVLWLVANRPLPYDRPLTEAFRDVEEVGGDAAFRVIRAAHPRRGR